MIRYYEHSRYDVSRDAQVVRMMATGNRGTWWGEVEETAGTSMREKRTFFKRFVQQAVKRGHVP